MLRLLPARGIYMAQAFQWGKELACGDYRASCLVEAAMFTRLDEMREGDFFYIEVMGETLGYEVDRMM